MRKNVKAERKSTRHRNRRSADPRPTNVVSIENLLLSGTIEASDQSNSSVSNDEHDFGEFLKLSTRKFLISHNIDSATMEPMGRIIDLLVKAAANPDAAERISAVAAHVEDTFTEQSAMPIPQSLQEAQAAVPTILEWKAGKQPGDTPPDFIKRHYGMWLGKGLTRAHFSSIDPPLYQALRNWLRDNPLPADCPLPTKKEHNDALLAAFSAGNTIVSLGYPDRKTALLRLGQALENRERGKGRDRT